MLHLNTIDSTTHETLLSFQSDADKEDDPFILEKNLTWNKVKRVISEAFEP